MCSTRAAILGAAALALAGCAREAGAPPDWSPGGATIAGAMAVQSGGRAPSAGEQGRLPVLAAAFATSADTTVTFAFGSARLDAAAERALASQAAWLAANPDAAVRITGHADAPGSAAANDRLGLRRAEAAARALASLGVAPDRIAAVETVGARDPAIPVTRPERFNRRAVTEVAWIGRVPRALPPHDGVRARAAHQVYQNPNFAVTDAANDD